MTFTISLGWWLAPLAVTITAYGWAKWVTRKSSPYGGYMGMGAIADAVVFGFALIVMLIAWLIWALLT